jgi:hypothetical protein
MSTGTQTAPDTTYDPWEMEVGGAGGQGDYVLCPAGNYPATIVGLLDVGHHPATNDKGESYDSRKLLVVFELAEQRPDGKPFVLAERYTWSMKSNSNFYSLASNLTGRSFAEGDRFDPRTLLGQAVMCQVVHKAVQKEKGTKTYHNIGSITQYPKGLPKPAPTITPVAWSALSGQALPDLPWVPHVYGESLGDLVTASREYQAGKIPPIAKANGKPATSTATAAASSGGDDNSIPF